VPATQTFVRNDYACNNEGSIPRSAICGRKEITGPSSTAKMMPGERRFKGELDYDRCGKFGLIRKERSKGAQLSKNVLRLSSSESDLRI